MEGYGRVWKLEQPYGTLWKPLATPINHFKAKTVNLKRMDTQTDRPLYLVALCATKNNNYNHTWLHKLISGSVRK